MAKKKRRSSGKKRASRSSGAGWKKSTPVAVVLVLVIVIVNISILSNSCGSGSSAHVMKNFPYTFMKEKGKKVIIKNYDSNKLPPIPIEDEDGELLWPAHVCKNPDCPYLKAKKKPLIFAFVDPALKKWVEDGRPDMTEAMETDEDGNPVGPPPEMHSNPPECPVCKKAKLNEAYLVDRYQTKEGQKILDDLRKMYEEKYKDSK